MEMVSVRADRHHAREKIRILPIKANSSESSRNQDTSKRRDYLFSEEPNSVLDFCSAWAWRVFRQTCGFSNSNSAADPGSGSRPPSSTYDFAKQNRHERKDLIPGDAIARAMET